MVVLGMSHHTSPVAMRERFAFTEMEVPEVLARMRNEGLAEEAVILSTCNRVEIYAATSADGDTTIRRLREFLLEQREYYGPLEKEFYALTQPRSIEHLFRVASGLDSLVLGETEILGQLKRAYDLALRHRHTGGRLNRIFQKAFNVAKQLRTQTNIQRGSVSVGSVAVELAEKIFSGLGASRVMIIGAGDTSEKTARALMSRGAAGILVSNRSHERATALANEFGGLAVRFEDWHTAFPRVDIIISSTSAPHYVLDRKTLTNLAKPRKNRPLLLIDIAVPRDIDPEVNYLDNVFLYNIDDLQAIANTYLTQRQKEIERCEGVIREKARHLVAPPGRIPFTQSRLNILRGQKINE